MSLTDNRDRYGAVSVALHWASFALIAALVGLGWVFADMPRGPLRDALAGLHMSLGLLFVLVLALRLGWRLANGKPQPLPSHTPLEQRTALAVHRLLTAVMILIPVAGLVTVASVGRAPSFFGLVSVPLPFVPQSGGLHEAGEELHAFMANFVLLPLLGLHVLGALKHHLLDKDATLRRMLGRGGSQEGPVAAT